MYRIELAYATAARRRAEADFLSALVTEARVSAETATTLINALVGRKSEARVHERYYYRLFQLASDRLLDAETDASNRKEEGKEMGLVLSDIGKHSAISRDDLVKDLLDGMTADTALFGGD